MRNVSRKYKVAIIHFQPLEGYPPVMNDIKYFENCHNVDISIFSTVSNNQWFAAEKAKTYRYGVVNSRNFLYRYFTYIVFNLFAFVRLSLIRPDHIFVYESLSVLPAFLVKLIRAETKIHIHFHEFISTAEISVSSAYFKWLITLEEKLIIMKNCTMSHTNEDRVGLYLEYHPSLDKKKVYIFPNYPPIDWYKNTQGNKQVYAMPATFKLIHVGALSLDTTYVKEMVSWVVVQDGAYQLDFYLSNVDNKTQTYLDQVSASFSFINVFPKVNYYDLPHVLKDYNVGLVLYNGSIPNYIYNVPNKVMEYLACGLKVWYSDKLVSTKSFVLQNNINGCYPINFKELKGIPEHKAMQFNKNDYFAQVENMLSKTNLIYDIRYDKL